VSRLAAARDEQGFKLVELLVAATIGTVVLFAAFGLIEAAVRGQKTNDNRIDAASRGRDAMEQISRRLRAQVCLDRSTRPIIEATADRVVFYSGLGPAPGDLRQAYPVQRRTLEYVPDGSTGRGSIVETVVKGDMSKTPPTFTGQPRTRTIVTNISRDGSTPVFRYYRFDPAGGTAQLTPPLSADQRARIVRIHTTFVAYPEHNRDAQRVKTRMDSSVTLRMADPNSPTSTLACE